MFSHDARNSRATITSTQGNSLPALHEVPMSGAARPRSSTSTTARWARLAESDASGGVVRRSEYEPYGKLGLSVFL